MNKYNLDKLKAFNYLGEQQLPDGTLLIGRAPHIAPYAWLHKMYAPLQGKDIDLLEDRLGMSMPADYREFLKMTNGLEVFNTTFNLYGLRRNHIRDLENAWQPFDITTPNTLERPCNAGKNIIIIGGYDWDNVILCIDSETGRVHLCKEDNISSLYTWKNFETMLVSEINRLIQLFDATGKELDPAKSTLPV